MIMPLPSGWHFVTAALPLLLLAGIIAPAKASLIQHFVFRRIPSHTLGIRTFYFFFTSLVFRLPCGLSLSGRPKARLQCYVLRSKIEVCRRTTSALGIPTQSEYQGRQRVKKPKEGIVREDVNEVALSKLDKVVLRSKDEYENENKGLTAVADRLHSAVADRLHSLSGLLRCSAALQSSQKFAPSCAANIKKGRRSSETYYAPQADFVY
jgi:hypothetical protein